MLDHITDPHNLGAVLRSANLFSADLVVSPERRSAGINPTVVKTSAGASNYVQIETSSPVWTTYITLTTPAIPAGTYRIGATAYWRTVATSTFIELRVYVDGQMVFPINYENSSHRNDNDMRDAAYGPQYVDLTAGTHTITLDCRRAGTNGTVYLYGGLVEFWQIS